MKIRHTKIAALVLCVAMFTFFGLSFYALASETVDVDMGKLGLTSTELTISVKAEYRLGTPTYSATPSMTATSNSLALSITGKRVGIWYASTMTVTLTNSSAKDKTLSFDYTIGTTNEMKVAGTTVTTDGTYSELLTAGNSITVIITTAKTSTANTCTLSNINLVSDDTVSITFADALDGKGTMSFADGESNEIEYSDTLDVSEKLSPISGYEFKCWKDANGNILGYDPAKPNKPDESMTIYPYFAPVNSGKFDVNGQLFWYWEDAFTYATANSVTKVVFVEDGTLFGEERFVKTGTYVTGSEASGYQYTIPSGITFLVPFNSNYDCYTTEPGTVEPTAHVSPSVFCTLTMNSGANIVVNGTMSVSSKVLAANTTAGYNSAMPSGKYGRVHMNNGSSITVNNDASLCVWGYITGSGSGEVNAETGEITNSGYVEAMSGANVYEAFQVADFRGGGITSQMNEDKQAFPFSQYYIQNIEVPLKLNAGANENIFIALYMSKQTVTADVTFVASSDAMFSLSDGFLVKQYEKSTDRLIVDICGSLSFSPIKIPISALGLSINLNTGDFHLPINGNMTINIHKETTTIDQDLLLLPGTKINIAQDAVFYIASGNVVIAFDSEQWGKYLSSNYVNIRPVQYVSNRVYTRKESDLIDAQIEVAGILDASEGDILTTNSGASITGQENGRVIIGSAQSSLNFSQPSGHTSEEGFLTTSYTVQYTNIEAISAILTNVDNGNPASLATSGTFGTYTYINGYWHLGEKCSGGNATCTEKAKCQYCGQEYGEMAAHTPGAAATCTADQTCTVCGTVLNKATGHTPGAAATCTTAQTCTVCGEEVAPALGHDYKAVVTAPTCTAQGYTTHTCSVCGDSYVDSYTAKLGHDWKLSEGECGRCNDKIIQIDGITLELEGQVLLQLHFIIHPDFLNDYKDQLTVYVAEEFNSVAYEGSVLAGENNEKMVWNAKLTDSKIEIDSDGRYVISQGIAAGEMMSNVSVSFKKGAEAIAIYDKYVSGYVDATVKSVKDYLEWGIAQEDTYIKNLCEAAALFGGYAQYYYDVTYNDGARNPISSILSDTTGMLPDKSELAKYTYSISQGDIGIKAISQRVNLDDIIYLRVYFELTGDLNIDQFKFEAQYVKNDGSMSAAINPTPVQVGTGNVYYVDIANVEVANWDNEYTITVTRTDGTEGACAVTTSVLAWANSCVNDVNSTDKEKTMALAMLLYNQATDAYFTNKANQAQGG